MHTSKNQNQFFNNFRGEVKTHEANGFCRIFIPGIYPDEWGTTSVQNLPIAEPAQPLFAGGNDSNGTFQYPDIGSVVWLFFEYGDISRPVYFACTNKDKSKFKEGLFTIKFKNSEIIIEENQVTIKSKRAIVIESDSDDKNKCQVVISGSGGATITGNLKVTGNIESNTGISNNTNGISFKGGVAQ